MNEQETVNQVVDEAAKAQAVNPQSGPQEILDFEVTATTTGAIEITEKMSVPVPQGFRNYAQAATLVGQGLNDQGGFINKLGEKEFDFYPLSSIEKFHIEFKQVSGVILDRSGKP